MHSTNGVGSCRVQIPARVTFGGVVMDKWTQLRQTIQELHDNNADKPDVEEITRFLLNLMKVLDGK